MKKYKLTISLIILFLLVYGLGSIFYHNFLVVDVDYWPLVGGVTYYGKDKFFVDVNASYTWFGEMKPGIATRVPKKIENNQDFPIRIELKVVGHLKDFVVIEEKDFLIEPDEEKKVFITFYRNPTLEEGYHFSKLKIIEKRILL